MDALAKQSHDLTLTSLTHCADLILNSQCTSAFRKYICLVNFPHCDISTGAIIKPCRSVCENYCDECKLSSCPCFDLPLKKSGNENCVELKDICDPGNTGRCAWDVIE